MKQLLQNLKNGHTEIVEVPTPGLGRGQVLVESWRSLVSAGTERMLVDFGKAGWIEKTRQQPEKVKQVLDKIRADGVIPAAEAVFRKLDEPMPLGYCNAGIVVAVGPGITDMQVGDRVANNGPHAEVVCVPRNLCANIPDGVTDDEAAFTVLGAIALQGVRLAVPSLGERFVVFGLGVVGLLTVQLLRASGCQVLAVDMSPARLRLAEGFGAEVVDLNRGTDPVAAALAWTGGRGVDGALIAASAKGDEIVHQAAQTCRKRGRIVLVGVVDLNLRRNDFYEKEITFQVSCSYGPGRYDTKYEQGGHDYPIGYVRWTEQRNFEAVLDAMRTGQLRVQELITHRLALEEAAVKYDMMLHDPEALGILIEYPKRGTDTYFSPQGKSGTAPIFSGEKKVAVPVFPQSSTPDTKPGSPVMGVIGAGNYARSILLPRLKQTGTRLAAVADIDGVAAAHAARKFGAGKALTDYREILADPEIGAVFILVGHHLHAPFVVEALAAGKHVFVEKPLAITMEQLSKIGTDTYLFCEKSVSVPILMVGFNRRFSPHTAKIRQLLAGRVEPLTMTMTVNAGYIAPEHWTQDPERGGGRIIGEGCHFIDLLSFLAGAPVVTVSAAMVGGTAPVREDKMSILLTFSDGSVGTVHYFANGARSYPKETLEIFSSGRVIRMENFRITRGYGLKGFNSFRTWRQDKGHWAEIAAFISAAASGGPSPIPFDQIVNVTRASFAAVEAARNRTIVELT